MVRSYVRPPTGRADLGEKEALLASNPEAFFSTDHCEGYRAVLVRLDVIGRQELAEVVSESWRAQAPKRLLSAVDER